MNPAIGRENNHLYEFGAFRLDPAERVLARDGERISLAPKAFDFDMVTPEQAAQIAGVSPRTIHRWVEERNLHFVEARDGPLLICQSSLWAWKLTRDRGPRE